MLFSSPAEIFGVDGLIILVVVALVLFGSTQIPKLARSLGSAQKEFKQGLTDGEPPRSAEVTPVPRRGRPPGAGGRRRDAVDAPPIRPSPMSSSARPSC